MKKIEAIVEADQVRTVCEALLHFGLDDLTVTDCADTRAVSRLVRSYRTANLVPDLRARYQIEFVVPPDRVNSVVKLIANARGQNANGHGALKVSSIDMIVDIRDGQRERGAPD